MKSLNHYISIFIALGVWASLFTKVDSYAFFSAEDFSFLPGPGDTTKVDTVTDLPYPFDDNNIDPLDFTPNPWYLNTPSNVTTNVELNPQTNEYDVNFKMGNLDYRRPTYLTFQEYQDEDFDRAIRKNWRDRISAEDAKTKKAFRPTIYVEGEAFERIFGSNTIDIRPQGSAELIFGGNFVRTENPQLPIRQQRVGAFRFDQKIQMNVLGKIGEKIQLNMNYNTETGFNFDNRLNLKYEGDEDDIIKLIEAGNVNMPLNGTLIQGSQSLMGIKTKWQFGKLTATTLFAQQQGDRKNIQVQGGAQTTQFEISASNYEANRHYFLAHYFKDQYDQSLSTLPNVTSPFNITRLEVYVTNRTFATVNVRNIAAFADLGESNPLYFNANPNPSYTTPAPNAVIFPRNENNNLNPQQLIGTYPGIRDNTPSTLAGIPQLVTAVDYEYLQNARLLNPNEYTFDPALGFISLNQALNADEVLAVAFQYTSLGASGQQVFQVGEFATDVQGTSTLVLKMLKSTILETKKPIWDIMMKNIYSLGGFQISRDNFILNILYQDEKTSIKMNVLPEGQNTQGRILLQLLNLDRLNNQNDPQRDGFFDFIEGRTINSERGRVIFPVREPFGGFLRSRFNLPQELTLANKYAFDSLYTTTQPLAALDAQHNRYYLQGSYRAASGSEISLNALNIPPGSVVVTAGGVPLQENVDYTVDYALGRVRIINEGLLNSQTPINISLESNSLFAIQSKRLMGTRFDYVFNKDFALGGTIMNYTERPITQKINIGDEPISNTIWGIDGNYRAESRLITKLVDKLPFYSTKEISNITASFETAHLIPGHSKIIGRQGISYIDDFEGAESAIDIRNFGSWSIASVPSGQNDLLPEGSLFDDLRYGFNRARINWFTIDPLFSRSGPTTPNHIQGSPLQSNNFMRQVVETEIFPNKARPNGQVQIMPVLDIQFDPRERGPYNYDAEPSEYSAGVAADGGLNEPRSRWGGIMRRIETTDWEAANIDYIEFWMMDPFANQYGPGTQINPGTGGDFFINIGNISEDVLKDGRQAFENGLPIDGSDENIGFSSWGKYPTAPPLVNAFDFNPDSRQFQDVGMDGLNTEQERDFFNDFLTRVANLHGTGSQAYQRAFADPSSDDYRFFRSSVWDSEEADILKRYTLFNGLEGNSRLGDDPIEPFPTASSPLPNVEDINRDNTLNTAESYFQYRVSLRPQDMIVGQNFIVDKVPGLGKLNNGDNINVDWYQFRVPVRDFQRRVGGIQDFRSIRFIRMFLHGWQDPVVMRMARLELVRAEWRRFEFDLTNPGLYIGNDLNTTFQVSTVNIEENGVKDPVNYVLPPEINREIDISTTNLVQLNEQSLQVKICNLADGDARAVFRNTDMDIRAYRRMRLEVHASSLNGNQWADGQITAFIRLGTDFVNNYYEYEVPLRRTPDGSATPEIVWYNNIDFELELLQNAKLERNRLMQGNPNIMINEPFVILDPNNPQNPSYRITVVGVPQISGVKTIMLGIRNPRQGSTPWPDDGSVACAEIWFNELRVSEYFERGGWAANARVTAKLADLGTLALAGSRSTFGFGSIEQKPSDRNRNNITAYNIISNLELGKFFPARYGITVPFYFEFGEIISNPQFNPLDPDITYRNSLDILPTDQAKDNFRQLAQDYQRRRSYNFTNVKKNAKQGSKPRFYSISNFDFTYAFAEIQMRNPFTEYNNTQNYTVGAGYNFSPKPKSFEPFKKSKIFGKSKAFDLIKDFNIGLAPSRVAMRSDILRDYNEMLLRNTTTDALIVIEPTYFKSFTWNRIYDIKYPLTKSLNLDFMATNMARIDEEPGRIDTPEKRDSIIRNLRNFGRNTNYQHNFNASYNVPTNKIPILNWINLNTSYNSTYSWVAAPLVDPTNSGILQENPFGNIISNSQTVNLSGQMNFTQLYNKVPYLKKINQKRPGAKKPTNQPTRGKDNLKKDPKAARDTTKKGQKEKEPNPTLEKIKENTARFLMMVKNVSVTYSENNGTSLPGYIRKTQNVGLDRSDFAPGIPFILGDQRTDIRALAGERGWLTNSTEMNNMFMKTTSQNFTANATIEPLNGFRITLNANRTFSQSESSIYRFTDLGSYTDFGRMVNGTFSISFFTWNTAFERRDNATHTSENFDRFLANRRTIATRLQDRLGQTGIDPETGYPIGLGSTQQDVLLFAFLTTYSGTDPSNQDLTTMFPRIPKPNWRVTYDGLSKIEFFKKYFRTISVSHGYRSSFNLGSFTTNLLFETDANGMPTAFDLTNNYLPQYNVLMATISEQFGPLINLDVTMKNSVQARVEIRKSRDLSLSFQNSQLTEINGDEISIGTGYIMKNVTMPFKVAATGKNIKSDLNIRADISVRTNKTVVRKIPIEGESIFAPILSAGQRNIAIKTSADYVINTRVTVRLFFDRILNRPFVSNQFPNANTNAGLSLRFSLNQ
ncbi:MAG: cell surface protein SprA [Flavobacteriales bacterium]